MSGSLSMPLGYIHGYGDVYRADDGTEFDNQLARDKYNRGQLGLSRFTGGGGQRHVSGGPGSGGMYGGGMGGAYADAWNGARNANIGRYNDILSGYDAMLGGGGGGGGAQGQKGFSVPHVSGGPVGQWRDSGSQMSFSEWRALQKKLEQQAAQYGGAYGSIDASKVFPRMYGEGEFLGVPGGQAKPGGEYGQRPSIPPPVYPSYSAPSRGKQNY